MCAMDAHFATGQAPIVRTTGRFTLRRSPTTTSRRSPCGADDACRSVASTLPHFGEHPLRAYEHRPIDHLAVEQCRIAARARERFDDTLGPRDVVGGQREAAIDDVHLSRMDAELAAEAELPRPLAITPQELR